MKTDLKIILVLDRFEARKKILKELKIKGFFYKRRKYKK